MRTKWLFLIVLPLIIVPLAIRWPPSPHEKRLAEFSTSLNGRTEGQRHNAEWAVKRLNGAIIQPGAAFAFNRHVGPWGRREGVVRAPVSYGGILVPSWGGGVCQVSTTLYCAALLAGLNVTERHSHEIAPSYVPAGMDAAVAYGLADLKIKNPHPCPVAIRCEIQNNRLICRITALDASLTSLPKYRLVRELIAEQPAPVVRGLKAQGGRSGIRVRLWRIQTDSHTPIRELCHETEYAPLARTN